MSEQQAPRPGQDEATAEAVESAAVTESGPAPAAAPEVPSSSDATETAGAPEQDAATGAEAEGTAAEREPARIPETSATDQAPADETSAAPEPSGPETAAPAHDEPGPAEHADALAGPPTFVLDLELAELDLLAHELRGLARRPLHELTDRLVAEGLPSGRVLHLCHGTQLPATERG